MKSHEQINEMLPDYVLRELQSRDRKEVLDHIENCDQCREELSRLESLLNCAQRMGHAAVDEQTCEDSRRSILTLIEGVPQSGGKIFSQFSEGRKKMKNSILKFAAAALILTAAITAISIYTVNQEPQGNVAATSEEQLQIKADAEQIRIEQMAAAKDVEGLIQMLDTGEFASKVKAAQWLGKIGNHRALPALQNLTSGDIPDGYTNAPVLEAIENITNTAGAVATQVKQDINTANLSEKAVNTVIGTPVVADNQLLDLIPAKTAFCAIVNNFDNTFGMIDQYASGIMPIPATVTMGTRMLLVSQIGNPALTGVNTTGSFAIFGKAFAAEPNSNPMNNLFIGLLVPVPDYDKFVEGNPNFGPADTNGVSIIKTGGMMNSDKKQLGVR
ncbi:MAG: zf-HC2 domain-containing protein, partial [Candidatus Brocadiia bacterium]